ncbi:MAG TPA: GbsR/MarR family transcriptional regulator [Candidatus Limnocylindria bacterium]|jgi:DNA-binding transcriptional regulator GbsR (MarR family)|nr:GbsR/MarR family transcriptional regulator [Candidatus Limnocylindria bacterium]
MAATKALSDTDQKFILHWGEMGARWGINRTVAQVHALLFISPKPLNAEYIQETLGVARSNVSTSLRELQGWGIVRLVHLPGDRRDHYESTKDVWDMFRTVLDERKKREVDPTLAVIRECLAEANAGKSGGGYTAARLKELEQFFTVTTSWYTTVRNWPTPLLVKFLNLGEKLKKLAGLGAD